MRSTQNAKDKVVFGRSYSNANKNCANQNENSKFSQGKNSIQQNGALNKETLDQFNVKNKNVASVEDQIELGKENKNTINMEKPGLPPKTPNYGKTPKYIEKFKEEAKQKEDARLEAKAARNRPAGTRVLPEEERISTLETL